MASTARALSIDIGGTQIKAGIISADGEILAIERMDTPVKSSPELIVQHIFALQQRLCRAAGQSVDQLVGVGISIAAFISAEGEITATAHLSKEWVGYNLKNRLMSDLPLPYYFALDTPAPCLGEAYYGAGKGIADFVYVTVSTGIGAGIIAEGKYMIGGLGWAGGIGHTIIDETSERVCTGCGNHGCLETFAAKQGIIATALEMIEESPDSLLARQYRSNPDSFSPRVVSEIAQHGDPAAVEVFARAGHMLGIGLTNLVDIVSPTRVVIGGGIALAGDLLLEPARKVIRERAFPPKNREVEVVQAGLGDLSGMYGAAAMVFNDIRVNP
jgi:glucokinase